MASIIHTKTVTIDSRAETRKIDTPNDCKLIQHSAGFCFLARSFFCPYGWVVVVVMVVNVVITLSSIWWCLIHDCTHLCLPLAGHCHQCLCCCCLCPFTSVMMVVMVVFTEGENEREQKHTVTRITIHSKCVLVCAFGPHFSAHWRTWLLRQMTTTTITTTISITIIAHFNPRSKTTK